MGQRVSKKAGSKKMLLPDIDFLTGVRVLFAEDEDSVISAFDAHMRERGWHGIYVPNAIEMMNAVNLVNASELILDGIVADIKFVSGPKLTGITAVREIRKILPNVPVIFISDYVTSIIREEVRRVEAEIIQKPFDMGPLFARLSQLIYWNRLVTAKYGGEDRRRNSVNRSEFHRRASDYVLSTPERIAETLKEVGDKNERGQK